MVNTIKYELGFLVPPVLFIMIASCHSGLPETSVVNNPDRTKTIIMNIQQQMLAASTIPDAGKRAKTYELFCEDSLIACSYENDFFTNSSSRANDLYTKYLVPPHDYTFRLFGSTAILSFLETALEIIHADTIYHNVRITKTFAFDHGTWKMASISSTLQPHNYFTAVPEKHRNAYPEFAGFYSWSPSETDTAFVKDGELYGGSTANSRSHLFPVDDSTYMDGYDLGRVIFGRDMNGKVTYYTYVRYDGQRVRIPKIK
jgi:hypothetical protein